MNSTRIRPVSSGADLKRFIDFGYSHYRDNPYWIPPLRRDQHAVLDKKKNAFFEHGSMQTFLAEDASGRVVGRIAGIVNGMHLKKYQDGNGFFGFFECIESYDVASGLLDAAADWLRAQGLTGMRGPASPSLNDTSGLLVEGFDREPAILMPYNPAYYEDFLLRDGFSRAMTMWAFYLHKKHAKLDRLRRGVQLLHRRYPSVTLRTLDMKRFEEEAKHILHIFNDAWSKNWGHVPMTDAEFAQLTREFKQVIDPRLIYLLEDEGRPIAFSLTIPDMNEVLRHVPDGRLFPFGLPRLLARAKFCGVHSCRTPLMGILKEYQHRGLDAILHLAIIENGPKYGYDASELGWILDTNKLLINALESVGAVRDKQYALFEKSI